MANIYISTTNNPLTAHLSAARCVHQPLLLCAMMLVNIHCVDQYAGPPTSTPTGDPRLARADGLSSVHPAPVKPAL